MAEIKRPRRYYLHQRIYEGRCGEWGLAGAWRAKQEAQPGVLLPLDFPSLEELQDAGYTTIEDVDGADAAELAQVGIGSGSAASIVGSPYLTATFLLTAAGEQLVSDDGFYLVEG